jgi:HSP20 family molecular chaperone IbpA
LVKKTWIKLGGFSMEELKGNILKNKNKNRDNAKERINETLKDNNPDQYKDNQIFIKDKDSKEEFLESTKQAKLNAENILHELIASIKEKDVKLGEKIFDYKSECEKPLTDVLENDSTIIIRIDLPGVEREDISVHLIEKAIEIMALFPGKGDHGHYIRRERNYGKIIRTVPLSKKINEQSIKSFFKDCVLTIELPKLYKDRYKVQID